MADFPNQPVPPESPVDHSPKGDLGTLVSAHVKADADFEAARKAARAARTALFDRLQADGHGAGAAVLVDNAVWWHNGVDVQSQAIRGA